MMNFLQNAGLWLTKLIAKPFLPDAYKVIVDVLDVLKGYSNGLDEKDIKATSNATYAPLAQQAFKLVHATKSEWDRLFITAYETVEKIRELKKAVEDCLHA